MFNKCFIIYFLEEVNFAMQYIENRNIIKKDYYKVIINNIFTIKDAWDIIYDEFKNDNKFLKIFPNIPSPNNIIEI